MAPGIATWGASCSSRGAAIAIYNPLPLFHINCQGVTAMGAILTANCQIQPERFSPGRWWRDIAATRRDHRPLPRRDAAAAAQPGAGPEERAHAVKFGLGAGVEPQLHEAFEKRFGFPLIEVWGMTETVRAASRRCREPRQSRHAGLRASVRWPRVARGRRRRSRRRAGEPGELLVRHAGPRGRATASSSATSRTRRPRPRRWRGGWFHTGDVVRRRRTACCYFVDRKKNIIRRSGENIAAAEVEAMLLAHEAVPRWR